MSVFKSYGYRCKERSTIREFLINLLGGRTAKEWSNREIESQKLIRWIDQNRDFVLIDDIATVTYQSFDKPLVVNGSFVTFHGNHCSKDLYAAPWTRNLNITGNYFTSGDMVVPGMETLIEVSVPRPAEMP